VALDVLSNNINAMVYFGRYCQWSVATNARYTYQHAFAAPRQLRPASSASSKPTDEPGPLINISTREFIKTEIPGIPNSAAYEGRISCVIVSCGMASICGYSYSIPIPLENLYNQV